MASLFGLCGLQNLFGPKKDMVVPACPHCQKAETKPYKDLHPVDRRPWIWHADKGKFLCMKCTAEQKIEDKQRKQMADFYKKKEEVRKATNQERAMRRLKSGKRWERTKSPTDTYRTPDHIQDKVEQAMNDPKNNGGNGVMQRQDSLKPIGSSSSWAPDMTEEDVNHHPSEKKKNDLPVVTAFDFEPHSLDGVILEDEEEADNPPNPLQNGQVDWGELKAGGLVDQTVTEVDLAGGEDSD